MLGLWFLAALASSEGVAREDADEPAVVMLAPLPTEADRRAVLLRSLVEQGDPAAVRYTLRELERGLPPPVLAAFLDAVREHPHPAFRETITSLCHYRSVGIRARALLALAAQAHAGGDAARLAMDDADPRIRQLGLYLTELHTDPALEEAALLLRTREPELVL